MTRSAAPAAGFPVFDLDGPRLRGFHDGYLAGEAGKEDESSGLWRWVAENHRCNAALWQEEDRARATYVPDAEIVRCKRAIDAFNQRRNDAVEQLDQCLLGVLETQGVLPGGACSSETAGAMIDRLSILSLKVHHMGLQAPRVQAGEAHMQRCRDKLAVLTLQRADLLECFDRLLWEARCGAAHFKTYRQFKMYNDPSLNPELYRARAPGDVVALAAPVIDVLIPTYQRPAALAVTLTSVFAQTQAGLRVVISDPSETTTSEAPEVQVLLRLPEGSGRAVEFHHHVPRRGLAEQRHFLLAQARAPYVLFLDDDVVIEADLVARLLKAIREQGCGFVGSAVIGMSHAADERPEQQQIEFWHTRVEPEAVRPDSPAWARHHLHSAANLHHLQTHLGLAPGEQRLYRVAWVEGCVLFDTAKLRAAGGFDFWPELPAEHCGEDVFAQLRVMARDGGCGVTPSGAYHQEVPTTVPVGEVEVPRVLGLRLS